MLASNDSEFIKLIAVLVFVVISVVGSLIKKAMESRGAPSTKPDELEFDLGKLLRGETPAARKVQPSSTTPPARMPPIPQIMARPKPVVPKQRIAEAIIQRAATTSEVRISRKPVRTGAAKTSPPIEPSLTVASSRKTRRRRRAFNTFGMREAIVLSEILGPPVVLRPNGQGGSVSE